MESKPSEGDKKEEYIPYSCILKSEISDLTYTDDNIPGYLIILFNIYFI